MHRSRWLCRFGLTILVAFGVVLVTATGLLAESLDLELLGEFENEWKVDLGQQLDQDYSLQAATPELPLTWFFLDSGNLWAVIGDRGESGIRAELLPSGQLAIHGQAYHAECSMGIRLYDERVERAGIVSPCLDPNRSFEIAARVTVDHLDGAFVLSLRTCLAFMRGSAEVTTFDIELGPNWVVSSCEIESPPTGREWLELGWREHQMPTVGTETHVLRMGYDATKGRVWASIDGLSMGYKSLDARFSTMRFEVVAGHCEHLGAEGVDLVVEEIVIGMDEVE